MGRSLSVGQQCALSRESIYYMYRVCVCVCVCVRARARVYMQT